MDFHHVSVLRKETIANLITDTSGVYVDCTLGGGGHSRALADQLTGGGDDYRSRPGPGRHCSGNGTPL